MKLICEDKLFERVHGSVFFQILNEFLTKNTNIKYADDYIDNFDPDKKKQYRKEYPIADIKNDLFEFVQEWIDQVESLEDVYKINRVWMSKSYGFSNYIQISLKRPRDPRLRNFYETHRNLYDGVKFRFSEHGSLNDDSDITLYVNLVGKTFNQAATEMLILIENYITDVHSQEKQYLKKLDKARKKRR